MANTRFSEIARLKVSDSTEIVMSKVVSEDEVKGISIVPYITTSRYTGFSKGIFIPVEKVKDFKNLIAKYMS